MKDEFHNNTLDDLERMSSLMESNIPSIYTECREEILKEAIGVSSYSDRERVREKVLLKYYPIKKQVVLEEINTNLLNANRLKIIEMKIQLHRYNEDQEKLK